MSRRSSKIRRRVTAHVLGLEYLKHVRRAAVAPFRIEPRPIVVGARRYLFFLSVAGVSLTVATVWVAMGFWPVLPFGGLGLLVM